MCHFCSNGIALTISNGFTRGSGSGTFADVLGHADYEIIWAIAVIVIMQFVLTLTPGGLPHSRDWRQHPRAEEVGINVRAIKVGNCRAGQPGRPGRDP